MFSPSSSSRSSRGVGNQIRYRLRSGTLLRYQCTAFVVDQYRAPVTGDVRGATGFVRAFPELASASCSSFLYSMTDGSRAAIDRSSQTRSNYGQGKSQLTVVESRSFALRALADLQSHLPSSPLIPKCSPYECRQNRQSRQHASTNHRSVQSPIRPLAAVFHTFLW